MSRDLRWDEQATCTAASLDATGVSGDLDAIVAEPLSAIGWIRSDGTQLTGSAAADAGWDTRTLLWRLAGSSADGDGFEPGEPTSEGTLVTRTALCTWPAWGRP